MPSIEEIEAELEGVGIAEKGRGLGIMVIEKLIGASEYEISRQFLDEFKIPLLSVGEIEQKLWVGYIKKRVA